MYGSFGLYPSSSTLMYMPSPASLLCTDPPPGRSDFRHVPTLRGYRPSDAKEIVHVGPSSPSSRASTRATLVKGAHRE